MNLISETKSEKNMITDGSDIINKNGPDYDDLAKQLIMNYVSSIEFYKTTGQQFFINQIETLKQQTKQSILTRKRGELVFHGGCLGCTEQSVDVCLGCKYMNFSRNFDEFSKLKDLSHR